MADEEMQRESKAQGEQQQPEDAASAADASGAMDASETPDAPGMPDKSEASEGREGSEGSESAEAVAMPEPTPEERLQSERDEFEDRWLRAVAELDNLRKRTRREVADSRRFAVADLLRQFLDIQDDLLRALSSLSVGEEDSDTLRDFQAGFELISQRFQTLLKERGVQRIEAAGLEFDPQHHEAVAQIEDEKTPAGHVIEVVQEGYQLDDLVLRPARVVVAKD